MLSKPRFPTTRDVPDSSFRKAFDGLLNLLYPDICVCCSLPVSRSRERGVCGRCWKGVTELKITPPCCPSCGVPLPNFENIEDARYLCGECVRQLPPFSGARSFGFYSAELRSMIRSLKFQGRRDLADALAALMADGFSDSWERGEFDCIVPVPLHPRRRRDRGFNQAELLARSLARRIDIPWCMALERVKATVPQVGLTDSKRQENVREAFRCARPARVSGRRILLVDDVMTTGATVASATRALLRSGAARVSVMTSARTVRE